MGSTRLISGSVESGSLHFLRLVLPGILRDKKMDDKLMINTLTSHVDENTWLKILHTELKVLLIKNEASKTPLL